MSLRLESHHNRDLHLDFGNHNALSNIFDFIVPFFVKLLGSNPESYKYLLNSKKEYPEPDELIKEFENHGFKLYKRQDFIFGVISYQILQK